MALMDAFVQSISCREESKKDRGEDEEGHGFDNNCLGKWQEDKQIYVCE